MVSAWGKERCLRYRGRVYWKRWTTWRSPISEYVGERVPGFRSTQSPRPISPAGLAHAPQLPRRHPSTAGYVCTALHPAWTPSGRSRPRVPAGPTPKETHQTRQHGEGRGATHPAGPKARRRALLMLCVESVSTRHPKVLKRQIQLRFPLARLSTPGGRCASGRTRTGAQ